ncbi:hypothetical protein NEMIN01_0337 [Nematocida minor]|uniref:uncharacterized protein n=1 Tax=Nematocida minor TaxID=1912983 RepID=UPI002220003B|nr:uncharacterized protein NEMIN01_0337 [Nematocida minor]KAI5189171.1 hypothetical protein NEMIN01_0337 [Nematocida minor]
MVYVPMVPSELVVNEAGWRQYKEWLGRDASEKAVVMGRPGIGKETSIRLINKIHNYKEVHIDGMLSKEEISETIQSIEKTSRAKDIKGRSRIFVFRDVDRQFVRQILAIKNRMVKIVVIVDDVSLGKTYSSAEGGCEVVKMYSDMHRTHRRAENICRKIGIVMPDEISSRIREGEKIGKTVSDIEIFRRNSKIKGHAGVDTGGMGYIEALDKILHRRGGKRKSYSEIERVCSQSGIQTVQDLLFNNYLEKCLSIEDACTLSEYSSLYDVIGNNNLLGYDAKCVSVYQFHNLLYNTIFVSFKGVQKKTEAVEKGLIYNNMPISRLKADNIKELVSVLVRKVKKQSTPGQTDEYTKRSIRYVLEGLKQASFIEEKDLITMQSIDIMPTNICKVNIPRYIYKDGHSHYVTRDIRLSEILE